jgi:hypothetical protein
LSLRAEELRRDAAPRLDREVDRAELAARLPELAARLPELDPRPRELAARPRELDDVRLPEPDARLERPDEPARPPLERRALELARCRPEPPPPVDLDPPDLDAIRFLLGRLLTP